MAEATGPVRLGVLLSGGGRSLQNLLDRIDAGSLDARVACVIADRPAGGIARAEAADVPTLETRDVEEVWAFLAEHDVELVCLAGFLRLLPIPDAWAGRVLNIHPSLLPKFGGKGFYGEHVHRAVLAADEDESGCTVHFCDGEYDTGPVFVQRRVPVRPGDTVEALARRVFEEAECEAYPEAIARWARERRGGVRGTGAR